VHEADDEIPGEDDVRVDVSGCTGFFGGEVDPEAGSVIEDVEERGLAGVEVSPGCGYLLGPGLGDYAVR